MFRRFVLIAIVFALAAAACSSDDPSGQDASAPSAPEPTSTTQATTTTATTATTTSPTTTVGAPSSTAAPAAEAAAASYPTFTGDDFYDAPPQLLAGLDNGEVVWAEQLEAPEGALAWRVLYRSESVAGEPIGVSGFVLVPAAPPPEGGWPVISWAHGTTGIADVCAPTADPDLEADLETFFGITGTFGYALVATDYEGLGTPGVHTYVVGESAGRSVVDMVRAAGQIEEAGVGTRYVAWGHSQGGHAALWAGQVGPEWAPELDLVGVVAGAPPYRLDTLFDSLLGTERQGYLMMTLVSYDATYPEADLEEVTAPEALALIDVLDTGCLGDIQEAFEQLPELFTIDDFTATEPWASLSEANLPAQEPIAAPVLILHGELDDTIPIETSAELLDQICVQGGTARRITYPDKPHGEEVVQAYVLDMLLWMGGRFAGGPAPTDC